MGRSLQIQVSLINFEFKVGEMELEKNLIDFVPLTRKSRCHGQALQEAVKSGRGRSQTFTRDVWWSWPIPAGTR